MTYLTAKKDPDAPESPYREIIFSTSFGRYFFTILENQKEIFHSSFYKDPGDCAERGARYLDSLHQERPLIQARVVALHQQVRLASVKGKGQFNG